jgi:hypothetical protein
VFNFSESIFELFLGDGFSGVADGAAAESFGSCFLGADDMDGDVAGFNVILKDTEDGPAIDSGEAEVEEDTVGLVGGGEVDTFFAVECGEHFESVLVDGFFQESDEVDIIFDDEDGVVSGLDLVSVIIEGSGGLLPVFSGWGWGV